LTYLKLFSVVALALFLNACVSLSTIKTMQTMSDFDPLTSDMANLVFGVQATPKLKAQPDTSKYTMTLQVAGDGPSTTRFGLVRVEPSQLALNNIPQNRGKVLSLFQFSEEAKQQITAHQALLRDMKSKKTKSVSLSIGVSPDFCKTERIDYARERFSVYIAQGGKGDLMPLIDNLTLKELLEKSKDKEIRDC
jgi:hypothetical protein